MGIHVEPVGTRRRKPRSLGAKGYLKLLIGIGLIAVVGGGAGTFATFNATTTNAASFATGTLVLSNTVNQGTACLSTNGGTVTTGNSNGCSAVMNATVQEPGNSAVGEIDVKNAGSLSASTLTVNVASCTSGNAGGQTYNGDGNLCTGAYSVGTLSGTLSTTSAITALPVNALTDAVTSGDSVVLTDGANTQTFTASANAAVGATSISVSSLTPNFAYPSGTTTVSDSQSTNDALEFYVQEWNSNPGGISNPNHATAFDCWYGGNVGAGNTCSFSNAATLDGASVSLGVGPASDHLAAGETRYFTVGVELPSGADNSVQGLAASSNLTWEITQ